jgi:carboxymethylenebutenolidase
LLGDSNVQKEDVELGTHIKLTASDGHELSAYRADPDGARTGAVVVIQEIFGVNAHIRAICDRIAALGLAAIAPALFDRTERDFECGYSPDEIAQARRFIADPDWDAFVRDTEAARRAVADTGKVGIVGFCMGGTVAFLGATRLDGLACASCYYGGKIAAFASEVPKCPTQMHFGAEDQGIPLTDVEAIRAARKDCDIFVYDSAGHGFHCDERASFHGPSAETAWARTTALFRDNL